MHFLHHQVHDALLAGVATLVCAARHQKTLHLGRRGSVWSSRAECAEKVPSSSFATLPLLLLLLLLLLMLLPLLLYGQEEGVGWKTGQAGAASCAGRGRRGESETL